MIYNNLVVGENKDPFFFFLIIACFKMGKEKYVTLHFKCILDAEIILFKFCKIIHLYASFY